MNASGAGGHGWAPLNSANMYGGGDGGVCACARAHACVCVCSRVRACVGMGACVMCLQYTIIIFDLG